MMIQQHTLKWCRIKNYFENKQVKLTQQDVIQQHSKYAVGSLFEKNRWNFSTCREYQENKISDKRPRKSTDLEEYIALEPKNII